MADARSGGDRHPRVVLNALALRPGGSGVQTYIRELVAALPAAWPEARFAAVVAPAAARELPATVVPLRSRLPVDHGLTRRLLSLRDPGPADVVHGLDTDGPRRTRTRGAPATVVTVHDLALFDAPWAFPAIDGFVKRALVAAAIRRADGLIAVSAFTAERVEARFGRAATVVHEAPASGARIATAAEVATIRDRYSLPDRFVVHVGNLEPRKDVAVLAAACRAASVPLVLTGGAIRSVAVPAGARSIGYVPAGDLPALFGAATIVAYVSRYEGFGLPPIEAMACGAVVLATRVGAIDDVAAGGYEPVPVGDAEAMAAAIRALVADDERRAARRAAGVARAGALSWPATAAGTVAVYRRVLGS